MNVNRFFCGLLIFSAALFFLPGCKKDTNNKNANVNWASDNALAQGAFGDVKDWSDKAMAGSKLKSTLTDTVYMVPVFLPRLI